MRRSLKSSWCELGNTKKKVSIARPISKEAVECQYAHLLRSNSADVRQIRREQATDLVQEEEGRKKGMSGGYQWLMPMLL